MSLKQNKPVIIPDYINFLFGGISGMGATLFVQPLDLVKTRMQLSGENGTKRLYKNSLHAFNSIIKNEGITGIYAGLSASLLRQATYSTARMGIYQSLLDRFSESNKQLGFLEKIAFGVFAGGVAGYIGTPTEVALIRMTADGRLPENKRIGYKNVFDALYRIATEESFFTLWKGATPTVARSMVVNGAQLASYTQAKEYLIRNGIFTEGINLHFWASTMSGLITTIASMPFDIVKTVIQSMKKTTNSQNVGTISVLINIVKHEGMFSLWKGFTPYYARLGPNTVLRFLFFEQMIEFYKKIYSN